MCIYLYANKHIYICTNVGRRKKKNLKRNYCKEFVPVVKEIESY